MLINNTNLKLSSIIYLLSLFAIALLVIYYHPKMDDEIHYKDIPLKEHYKKLDIIDNQYNPQLINNLETSTEKSENESILEDQLNLYRSILYVYADLLNRFNANLNYSEQIQYLQKLTLPNKIAEILNKISISNEYYNKNLGKNILLRSDNFFFNKVLSKFLHISINNALYREDLENDFNTLSDYFYSKRFIKRFIQND